MDVSVKTWIRERGEEREEGESARERKSGGVIVGARDESGRERGREKI